MRRFKRRVSEADRALRLLWARREPQTSQGRGAGQRRGNFKRWPWRAKSARKKAKQASNQAMACSSVLSRWSRRRRALPGGDVGASLALPPAPRTRRPLHIIRVCLPPSAQAQVHGVPVPACQVPNK